MKRILFFAFLITFLVSFAILEMQHSDEEIIKEKLLEFGYPPKGYVIINNTIRYSDGSFVVLSTPPKKYPVSAFDAYKKAKEYLEKKEKEYGLDKYNYHLHIKAEDIEEYSENGNYYWAFKLYFGKGHSAGDLMGYILVSRDNGYCKIKGLFGG
ncbi:hypothetical protein [Methanocaldococcus fervens]|uniref:Uncharacterized protein n=1 Tax=Methanocaldococcus fervens (strain DSM 4213 / JCM 15782 / AG86) TaxID=573064 RepID=C7P9N4_METFA|nr:hypothetical protein [Methanocaldococcus fervens]ACV25391.1 hypothetical protein Mefer_1588 [Methanocaldococcus fervens AG86]